MDILGGPKTFSSIKLNDLLDRPQFPPSSRPPDVPLAGEPRTNKGAQRPLPNHGSARGGSGQKQEWWLASLLPLTSLHSFPPLLLLLLLLFLFLSLLPSLSSIYIPFSSCEGRACQDFLKTSSSCREKYSKVILFFFPFPPSVSNRPSRIANLSLFTAPSSLCMSRN